MKELLKLANIWQSYSKNKNGPVFWLTVYIVQEYARKEVEHAKAAADLQESYAAACKKMGIEVCQPAAEFHYCMHWEQVLLDLDKFCSVSDSFSCCVPGSLVSGH